MGGNDQDSSGPTALPFNANYHMSINPQDSRGQLMPPFDGQSPPATPVLTAVEPAGLDDIAEFALPSAVHRATAVTTSLHRSDARAAALQDSTYIISDGPIVPTPSTESLPRAEDYDGSAEPTDDEDHALHTEPDIVISPQIDDTNIFTEEDNAEALYVYTPRPAPPRRPSPVLLRSFSTNDGDDELSSLGDWNHVPMLPSYTELHRSSLTSHDTDSSASNQPVVRLPRYEESSQDRLLMTSTRRVHRSGRHYGSANWANTYLDGVPVPTGSSHGYQTRQQRAMHMTAATRAQAADDRRSKSRNILKTLMALGVICIIMSCVITAVVLQRQNSGTQSHQGHRGHGREHGT